MFYDRPVDNRPLTWPYQIKRTYNTPLWFWMEAPMIVFTGEDDLKYLEESERWTRLVIEAGYCLLSIAWAFPQPSHRNNSSRTGVIHRPPNACPFAGLNLIVTTLRRRSARPGDRTSSMEISLTSVDRFPNGLEFFAIQEGADGRTARSLRLPHDATMTSAISK
jgi:hypothetical protein